MCAVCHLLHIPVWCPRSHGFILKTWPCYWQTSIQRTSEEMHDKRCFWWTLLWYESEMHAVWAVPGCAGQRASMESTHSLGAQSTSTRSRRSSFALERASFDANRSSLERFGQRRNSTASRASMELAQVEHLLSYQTMSHAAAPCTFGAAAEFSFHS